MPRRTSLRLRACIRSDELNVTLSFSSGRDMSIKITIVFNVKCLHTGYLIPSTSGLIFVIVINRFCASVSVWYVSHYSTRYKILRDMFKVIMRWYISSVLYELSLSVLPNIHLGHTLYDHLFTVHTFPLHPFYLANMAHFHKA